MAYAGFMGGTVSEVDRCADRSLIGAVGQGVGLIGQDALEDGRFARTLDAQVVGAGGQASQGKAVALLAGWVLLGEVLSSLQVIACIAIVGAVVFAEVSGKVTAEDLDPVPRG